MRNLVNLARTAYNSVCDAVDNLLGSYQSLHPAYACTGAGNHILGREVYNGESPLGGKGSNLSFMARSDKRGGGKGGGRLHESSSNVWVMKGGQTIKIDKREKPKDMSLKQYIMMAAGVNEKAASAALKGHK